MARDERVLGRSRRGPCRASLQETRMRVKLGPLQGGKTEGIYLQSMRTKNGWRRPKLGRLCGMAPLAQDGPAQRLGRADSFRACSCGSSLQQSLAPVTVCTFVVLQPIRSSLGDPDQSRSVRAASIEYLTQHVGPCQVRLYTHPGWLVVAIDPGATDRCVNTSRHAGIV